MLWIEAVSMSLVLIVVVLVLVRHGLHLDWQQLQLRGMTGSGLRLVSFSHFLVLSDLRAPPHSVPKRAIR